MRRTRQSPLRERHERNLWKNIALALLQSAGIPGRKSCPISLMQCASSMAICATFHCSVIERPVEHEAFQVTA